MRNTWGLRDLLNRVKVRTKFILILLLAVTLIFVSVLATFRIPYRAYDEQLYKNSVQTITLFADKIQSELDDVENLSYRILADNVVQKQLSIMKRSKPNTTEWVTAKNEIDDRVANFVLWFSSVVCLQLQTPDGALFSQYFRTSYTTNQLTPEMVEKARGASGAPIWHITPGDPKRVLLLREIREISGLTLEQLAVILIEVDLPSLVEENRKMMAGLGAPLSCAIYSGENCLYASDEQVKFMARNQDGYEHLSGRGEDLLCVRFTAKNGWQYVTLVDYSGINRTISGAAALAMGVDLAVVVVAVLLSVWLVSSLLKHLDRLLDKFDDFAVNGHAENVEDSPYKDRGDEIGKLHRHFDRMALDYHRMMKHNFEQRQLLQEKQIQQLRAQIRPHFLNNTLESIYCLAKQAGNERIAVMTDALGKMLRASLNDKRDIVSVRDDLQITREYLRIQEIRHGDRMRVEIEVDEQLLDTRIPAMTLQPLVENAVHHALEEMLEVCVIRITGERTEKGVSLTVTDNGPGMDEDILNKLESGEIKPEGMGIGMRNIHLRVRYAFGEAYGLTVQSRPGCTRVTVNLPDKGDGSHV